MEMHEYPAGTPSWVDLSTPDTDTAAVFYGALFGWDVPEGEEQFGGYRNATVDGKKVAGMMPQMNPGPPVWTSYVSVDDAAATLAAVGEAGGSVVMGPMEVGPVGTMGLFADPQGAVCGIWQPGEHKGAELVNEPRTMCWNELSARDVDAAIAFYPQVFGWEATTSTDGPMPYTEWSLDGRTIGGMMPTPPMVPAEVPSHWLVYFAVDDCDATIAKAAELGGNAMMEAIEIPIGRFCGLTDDQGAMFAVIALSGEGMD
ncbi:MAG: VOC family protein [Acidimicrobiales bacterium]